MTQSTANRTIRIITHLTEKTIVVIDFIDNGPGLEDVDTTKLFEPFFTTKETGTGLGLSMVHRIIDAHGGHIRVTAGPHSGACFVIELPLDATQPDQS